MNLRTSMLCVALFLSGCGGGGGTTAGPQSDPAAIASIAVAPIDVTLMRGETLKLNATVRNASGQVLDGGIVQWHSEDGSIVTVTATGVVQAVRPGRAAIHASAQGKSASVQVVVNEPPAVVSRVEIDSTSVRVEEGAQQQLRATAFDAQGNLIAGRGERWSTGSPAIVNVSPLGMVTALRTGVAAVRVQIDGQQATASIHVFADYPYDLAYGTAPVGAHLELYSVDLRDPASTAIPVFPVGRHVASATPSPSGDRIAFVVQGTWDAGHWQSMIYVVNRDGTGVRRLTFLAARNDSPTWSPDGSRIAFSSQPLGARADIWVMDADGSNPLNITGEMPDSTNASPAWSPALAGGDRIAWTHSPAGLGQLWTMRPDGSDKRPLIGATDTDDAEAAWSPDGQQIVFRRSSAAVFGDLFLVSGSGGTARPLMPQYALPSVQLSPSWSPDGKLIAFVSKHGDGEAYQVWTVWSDGTRLAQRTFDSQIHAEPTWITRN